MPVELKKIPKVVMAENISVKEARQVRLKLFQELIEILKDILKEVYEVITVEVKKSNQKSLHTFKKIQDQLENLMEDVKNTKDENLDAENLEARTNEILTLFKQVKGEPKSKMSFITTETNLMIARSKIRHIIDAESIIKDPNKAIMDWSFQDEREFLAAEIQARFPTFLGYRVKAVGRTRDLVIDLISTLSEQDVDAVSSGEAFKTILEEFLDWELRKTGFSMVYHFTEGANGKNYVFYCWIDFLSERAPLSTILQYQHEPAKLSQIDTTVLKKFLIEQFKLEVDKEYENWYSVANFYPPAGQIISKREGPWLWIRFRVVYGGRYSDPGTDRIGGDPTEHQTWRDWVGRLESAPAKVSHPEELDEWALINTTFKIYNLSETGRKVDKLTKNGIAEIKIYEWIYPESTTKIELVDLKKISKIEVKPKKKKMKAKEKKIKVKKLKTSKKKGKKEAKSKKK